MKPVLDEALAACPAVRTTIVVEHLGHGAIMDPDRDVTWSSLMAVGLSGYASRLKASRARTRQLARLTGREDAPVESVNGARR